MKITYKPNPLESVIELTEWEKKELWYKIKIEVMTEHLLDVYFALEERPNRSFDLDRARRASDIQYFYPNNDNERSRLDKRTDELYEYYLAECDNAHVGDCTCVAASCMKCHLESMLGIDTMPGLRKHEAAAIDAEFSKGLTIEEVIRKLETYDPTQPSEHWKDNPDMWAYHLPRWKQESANAAEWLKKYKEEHGITGCSENYNTPREI